MSWCTLYRALCAVLVFQGVSAIMAATTIWSGPLQNSLAFGAFVAAQAAGVAAVSIRYVIPGEGLRAVALGGSVATGALVYLGSVGPVGPSLLEQAVRTVVWIAVMVALRGLWPRLARLEEQEGIEFGDAAA